MPSKRAVFARKLRADQTSSEDLIWNAVRGRRFDGFKFRRQMPIGRFTADFCCVSAKLIIEVDGAQHAEHADYDDARRQFIEDQGFIVLRFTNEDVRGRLDWVMQEIGRTLDLARGLEARRPFPKL
jgi:very-short-patch-repair endonuclease